MRKFNYAGLFFLGLLSCTNAEQTDSKKNPLKNSDSLAKNTQQTKDSSLMAEIDPSNLECVPTTFTFGDSWTNFSPGTLKAKTYVYNSMKSGAKIIDTLLFNSPVNILSEYPNYFLICTQKGKSGYVKRTDIYLHSIFWGNKYETYLVGISHYGTEDKTSCASSKFKIVKINDQDKFMTEYNDSILGKEYEIDLIHNSALKNSDAVFYVNCNCYSEIGVDVTHFIVDNGKKISRLIRTVSDGDGGYSDISTVYLPVTLTNGKKIVLAKNGQITIDERTAKPEIYPYPSNLNIPINELIVVEEKSVELLWDDENKHIQYTKEGISAEKVTDVVTTFYQWDGTTLRKVKTIK